LTKVLLLLLLLPFNNVWPRYDDGSKNKPLMLGTFDWPGDNREGGRDLRKRLDWIEDTYCRGYGKPELRIVAWRLRHTVFDDGTVRYHLAVWARRNVEIH